jgi:hypothetical protein
VDVMQGFVNEGVEPPASALARIYFDQPNALMGQPDRSFSAQIALA